MMLSGHMSSSFVLSLTPDGGHVMPRLYLSLFAESILGVSWVVEVQLLLQFGASSL